MNPTASPPVTSSADVPRRVLCQNYSRCLDVAILKRWPGFSCEQCEDHELEPPMDADHWKEQAGRCRLLLAELFAPKPRSRRRRQSPLHGDSPPLRCSAEEARRDRQDLWLQDSVNGGTVRLPETFLAHLMLLLEDRPHE